MNVGYDVQANIAIRPIKICFIKLCILFLKLMVKIKYRRIEIIWRSIPYWAWSVLKKRRVGERPIATRGKKAFLVPIYFFNNNARQKMEIKEIINRNIFAEKRENPNNL